MRTRQRRLTAEYQTPPDLVMGSVMLALKSLPLDRQPDAIRSTVEHFRALHAGLPEPEWIQMLSEVAERKAET